MLAAIDWLNGFLVVAFLAISVMMILIVLIQRPQGGGLSGAFGSGAGSGQTAFGARTGDALTIATIIIFVVFLVVAAALNHTIRPPKASLNPTLAAPAGAATEGEGTGAPVPVTTVPVGGTNEPAPSQPPAEGAAPTPEGATPPSATPQSAIPEGAPAGQPAATPAPPATNPPTPAPTP